MNCPCRSIAILMVVIGILATLTACRRDMPPEVSRDGTRNQQAAPASLEDDAATDVTSTEPSAAIVASSDLHANKIADDASDHIEVGAMPVDAVGTMPVDATESDSSPAKSIHGAMDLSASAGAEREEASLPSGESVSAEHVAMEIASASGLDEPQVGSAARVYLPTTAGLLIVDVDVRFDGQPQQRLFHQRIDEVIAEAAGDSTTPLSWNRIFQHVRSNPQQFGQVLQGVGNQTGELIRRLDKNRNQVVEHDELIKLLFRNTKDAMAFRVRGTDYFRAVTGATSALFGTIDSDGDGALDDSELDGASAALLRLDQNADQQLEIDEVAENAADDNVIWNPRRSNRYGDVAMDLEGFVDWTMMSYSLDSNDDRTPFGIAKNPIAKLDQNGDGGISGEEAKGLLENPPHLSLLIQYSSFGSLAEIRVLSADSGVRGLIVERAFEDQVTVADSSLQFTIRATDRTGQTSRIPEEVFAQLDKNSDGFLEPSEIPPAASDLLSVKELDQNGDEKLTFVEVNQSTAPKLPIWAWQIRGRAAEFPDRVFAWLDVDQNLVLSTREIVGASRRLRECVQDDSPLRTTDVPDCYVLHLLRGDPAQDEQSFRLRPRTRVPSKEMPRWAMKMDFNGDNEISMQEFIGTMSQFKRLDRDGDGFIDATELQSDTL